ncbi:hypothetical protein F4777DRAFT_76186 [Nemania sp. FL0916]|nr:hypothetical protein F4777DRAFT_76186 [Nemania sp. FL0916]
MDDPKHQGNVSAMNVTASGNSIQMIGNFHYERAENSKAKQWRDVSQWLSLSDEAEKLQAMIHQQSRENHKIKSTGSWFIDSDKFQNWLRGNSRFMWVHGPMGCGKSVLFFLATEVIRELCKTDPSKILGYF